MVRDVIACDAEFSGEVSEILQPARIPRVLATAPCVVLVMRQLLCVVFLLSLFASSKMPNLFAFSHRTVDAGAPDPGWHIYDAVKEFDRMGVLKPRRGKIASPWR